ncbi:MAG: class I SAM-dependent methyltransferase [Flavobacteriales bacterium]|nr:class I SAM-dependent methyltransferase [Flavobacteriales bacterium]
MNDPMLAAWLNDFPVVDGVRIVAPPSAFETNYRRVRTLERRILTDEQVRQLPNGEGLWNAEEWRIRERGAVRLTNALDKVGQGLRVLEVGCGNGWLSEWIHQAGHVVMGVDAFTEELVQAARVFKGPSFVRADVLSSPLPSALFDVVVFAASFQYFPDPGLTIARCFDLLKPEGEVHIIDTILYRSTAEAHAATQRSKHYYDRIGCPEMAAHYHAHRLSTVQALGKVRILSTPNGMERTLKRFGRPSSPFTHAIIQRQ